MKNALLLVTSLANCPRRTASRREVPGTEKNLLLHKSPMLERTIRLRSFALAKTLLKCIDVVQLLMTCLRHRLQSVCVTNAATTSRSSRVLASPITGMANPICPGQHSVYIHQNGTVLYRPRIRQLICLQYRLPSRAHLSNSKNGISTNTLHCFSFQSDCLTRHQVPANLKITDNGYTLDALKATEVCLHGDSIKSKPNRLCHIYLMPDHIIPRLEA